LQAGLGVRHPIASDCPFDLVDLVSDHPRGSERRRFRVWDFLGVVCPAIPLVAVAITIHDVIEPSPHWVVSTKLGTALWGEPDWSALICGSSTP